MTPEEKYYIDELNYLLGQYKTPNRTAQIILDVVVAIVAVIVALALGVSLGSLWGYVIMLVLVAVVVLCVEKLGLTFKNAPIPKEKLAYHVCSIMEELIDMKEKGPREPDEVRIRTVGSGRHAGLYRRFITLYPSMASKKLEALANVDIPLSILY